MQKYLDLSDSKDQNIIDFKLRCLEIAVQMLGSKPYDPKAESGDEYVKQFMYMHNIIVKQILSLPEQEDGPEDYPHTLHLVKKT